MRVEVGDLFRLESRILEGCFHRTGRSPPLGIRRGDVISIRRHPVSDQLSVDPSPSTLRMFQLLQHHHRPPFSNDETIPRLVKGAGGSLRFVVAGGQGLERAETGQSQGGNRTFRSSGNHHIGGAALDDLP